MNRRGMAALLSSALVAGLALVMPPESTHTHRHAGDIGARPPQAEIARAMQAIRDNRLPQMTRAAEAIVHQAGARRIGRLAGVSANLFRTSYPGIEPTIGVDRNGWVYAQGQDSGAALFASVMLRSKDGGRTWTDVSPRVAGTLVHSYTEDPYLYVDPLTSRIFHNDLILPCHLTSISDDGGETWSHKVHSCDQPDHQTIFGGPPVSSTPSGYPSVLYMCTITGGVASPPSTASSCDKSTDGGTTFLPTGSLAFLTDPAAEGSYGLPGACDGAHGHGFVSPDGTVYLPRGWCGQPWLAISRDEGASWQRVQVASNGMPVTADGVLDHEAAVAADAAGNVYYFSLGRDRLPYLVVSRDRGLTWGKPMMIAPPGVKEAWGPAMTISPKGVLAFAYYGSTSSPGPPFDEGTCSLAEHPEAQVLGCDEPASYEKVTWNGYMAMVTNPLDATPVFETVRLNEAADPFIRGTCGPFRCKAAYDFIDVQFAPDGSAWAPFADGCAIPDQCTPIGELLIGHLVPAAATKKPAAKKPTAVRGRVVRNLPATGVEPIGAAPWLLAMASIVAAALRRRMA